MLRIRSVAMSSKHPTCTPPTTMIFSPPSIGMIRESRKVHGEVDVATRHRGRLAEAGIRRHVSNIGETPRHRATRRPRIEARCKCSGSSRVGWWSFPAALPAPTIAQDRSARQRRRTIAWPGSGVDCASSTWQFLRVNLASVARRDADQPLSSSLSSLKKRQSVPCEIILLGADLIIPARAAAGRRTGRRHPDRSRARADSGSPSLFAAHNRTRSPWPPPAGRLPGLGGAQVRRLRDRAQRSLGRDGIPANEFRLPATMQQKYCDQGRSRPLLTTTWPIFFCRSSCGTGESPSGRRLFPRRAAAPICRPDASRN